jgi:hypothetical protein
MSGAGAYLIDPNKGVRGVYLMEILPFADKMRHDGSQEPASGSGAGRYRSSEAGTEARRTRVQRYQGQGPHMPQSIAASALSSAISCLTDNRWNSS